MREALCHLRVSVKIPFACISWGISPHLCVVEERARERRDGALQLLAAEACLEAVILRRGAIGEHTVCSESTAHRSLLRQGDLLLLGPHHWRSRAAGAAGAAGAAARRAMRACPWQLPPPRTLASRASATASAMLPLPPGPGFGPMAAGPDTADTASCSDRSRRVPYEAVKQLQALKECVTVRLCRAWVWARRSEGPARGAQGGGLASAHSAKAAQAASEHPRLQSLQQGTPPTLA